MSDLTFHSLSHPIGKNDLGHQPILRVSTPTGRLRQIPLTRRDLLRLIHSAVKELAMLDGETLR